MSPIPCPFEIEPSWKRILSEELGKPYIAELAAFVEKERAFGEVYPERELVFNALWQTPYEKVRVVIVGQDPYHQPGQAHGLSFSVPKGVTPPPSLKNIFKEIEADLGLASPSHGCLISWAEQGVLLLNATLTVRRGEPMAHQGKGWERLTDAIIVKLCERKEPVVFLLWGKHAQQKCLHLDRFAGAKQHLVLTAAHPSPFSAHSGFFGCRHFSKANHFLKSVEEGSIEWTCD